MKCCFVCRLHTQQHLYAQRTLTRIDYNATEGSLTLSDHVSHPARDTFRGAAKLHTYFLTINSITCGIIKSEEGNEAVIYKIPFLWILRCEIK